MTNRPAQKNEITDEMVKAGISALVARENDPFFASLEQGVRAIYNAMEMARVAPLALTPRTRKARR
jgi:hypothetical protein